MADFPTVYLLRHGQTEWNAAGRLQGHMDSNLTPTGVLQAQTQGRIIAPILAENTNIDVYASPLGRAAMTARIALEGTKVVAQANKNVMEISAGSWDGKTLEWIERTNGPLYEQSRNAFELMFLSPDGETEASVLGRAQAVLDDLSGPTMIFTHGAFLCVLRGLLRGLAFEDMLDLNHEQGCVYKLENGQETILRAG